MDTQARAFEYEIAQLSERTQDAQTVLEKQRLYARVGQFLMGSFEGHWWCRYPSLMVFMMRLLELYPTTESVRVLYEKMATQLGLCCKCVDIYHASLPSVRIELEYEFTQTSIKAFFCKLSQLDAERVHGVFTLKALDPSGGVFAGGSLAQTSRAEKERIAATMSTTMYEVLSQRRLFSDFRVIRVISKWLSSAPPDVKELLNLELLRDCPGVYQLLVSPDAGVRAWAISLIQKFGAIDLSGESGQEQPFLKVLDEWMYILESGSFNVSVLSLDLQSTEELPLFLETTNCIKTPTNQTLWAALDTTMQQMDETSLEVMLEAFDNLPDLVFNYLNDADPATTNQQVTFVICKCYAVMLRCLGNRFWNHTVHTPKIVLDMVIQHCQLPSWRVFVTKQLVELLPPLLASSRPSQISSKQSNRIKLDFYLRTRERLLLFLIDERHRPAHFSEAVLKIAASKAVSTIICDCYEPRLKSVTKEGGKKDQPRDDGALPESQLIDYSVSESAFWWPCGSSASLSGLELEQVWANSLFHTIVNPENVVALIDHAAITCSTILSKHLLLARDVVFTCFIRGDEGVTQKRMEEMTKSKPIITLLLGKLCAWKAIATIPVTVHGALFESIGGISEILNVVDAQANPSEEIVSFTAVLKQYEAHLLSYLERICDEVLVKGLTNPLRFPVVAQHTTLCLLNPSSAVDQNIKRLLSHVAAAKNAPGKQQSILESFLISVHRNTEAFLRGVLSLLQSLRLFDFNVVITAPTLKKIIFIWAKVFEMLGSSLQKILEEDTSASNPSETSAVASVRAGSSSHVKLQKLPILINDFLVSVLTSLYNPSTTNATKAPAPVDESVLVRILDFAVTFWIFWTEVMKDKNAATKRSAGLIAPLVRCMENGSAAEKPRAAELLMIVLETLLRGSVALDDGALRYIESVKSVSSGIASKRSTDFSRMATKFQQLEKSADWFSRRSTISDWRISRKPDTSSSKSRSTASGANSASAFGVPPSRDRSAQAKSRKDAVEEIDLTGSTSSSSNRAISSSRPMSGKAAARAQARMAVDLTGVGDAYSDSRKNHSFYTESDYVAPRTREPSPAERDTKTKANGGSFSMSQVIKGISHVHGGSNQSSSNHDRQATKQDERLTLKRAADSEKEEEAQEEALQFAGLFHRIKNTQKPIPVCSLLPFYRQLLQLCMPLLLTRQFQNERSDKVLQSPDLSFKKSSEYVNAYLPLLLEECNNELQEGLRKCYSGGGGHLLRYESEKPREGMRCLTFTIAEVDEAATTSSFAFKSNFGNRGTPKDKVFRSGDVVLMRIVGGANPSGFMGSREFIGIIMISEAEKGKKRVTLNKKPEGDEEENVKVLFLNDGELDSVTEEVNSFSVETLSASAIGDSEWKVHCIANLTTSAREYISLRSVDMLPEHLRTTILTPNVYKSTQTELILITTALDELRSSRAADADTKVLKLLKRLDKMDVTLMDLRSTSIGKAINKLRKHENKDVKALSRDLKDKWTQLMNEADALERAPRFLSSELWDAIKAQYNQSQLQSVHSVLNNYNVGISLLQGPPGTGKTKTIMGLLSGFLALQPPALAIMSTAGSSIKSSSTSAGRSVPSAAEGSKGEFSNFQLAREVGSASAQPSPTVRPTFSLSAVTSAMGSILRRTDSDQAGGAPKKTTIQALKNVTSVRSRLEDKLSGARRGSQPPPPATSSLVIRQRVVPSNPSMRMRRSNNVLLCAPSNGAVDELVLRIVTDGLMDSTGKIAKVRAPSVHPEALTDDWLSIVRLGNPGEDAPDIVKSVCLPQIIKRELEIHPKSVQLRALQDTQQTLRKSIRDFHLKAKEAAEASEAPKSRKGLAQTHAQLTKISGEVRRLRDEVFALRTKMTAAILSRASIIACTLSKSGSGPLSGLQRGFDALIVDEAAQAVELSTLVPIRERVARVVLVGDPKQLPATVKSVVAANARYDRSLFERIAESGVAPSMLRVQYRMHPFLRDFPSKRFYGGMLTDGPSVMERVQRVCPEVYKFPCFQPFLLYDVSNSREEDMGGSKFNRVEAQFCIEVCQNMFQMCTDARKNNWSVGFVSPYKEQVRVLRREISRSSIPGSISIEVNTVDGFQGREKDVIIFSCVRASNRGGIGFLKDVRRLNVAITRARFCLFVVGHVNTLVRDETWAALVRSADERRLVIRTRGSRFPEVARRLESGENKSLVEHFKDMHEKASKKQAALVAPTAAAAKDSAPNPAEAVAALTKSSHDGSAAVADAKQEGATSAPTVGIEPQTGMKVENLSESMQIKDEYKVAPITQQQHRATSASPSGSSRGLNPRQPEVSDATVKRETHAESRTTVSSDRVSPRPSAAAAGKDDAAHPARYSDASRNNNSNSYRERDSHRDSDRFRKREYDRGGDEQSKRPRHESRDGRWSPRDASHNSSSYRRDDLHRQQQQRPYQQQKPPSASDPVIPPKSISAKEFCMENEPPPRKLGDRGVVAAGGGGRTTPAIDHRHPKRPREDDARHHHQQQQQNLFPPGHKFHAREQQQQRLNGGGYRSVSITTSGSSATHPRLPSGRTGMSPHSGSSRPPSASAPRPSPSSSSSGGRGLLKDIIGSASRLASMTSRAHENQIREEGRGQVENKRPKVRKADPSGGFGS